MDGNPQFSPDGKDIAFQDCEIWIAKSEGSSLRQMARMHAEISGESKYTWRRSRAKMSYEVDSADWHEHAIGFLHGELCGYGAIGRRRDLENGRGNPDAICKYSGIYSQGTLRGLQKWFDHTVCRKDRHGNIREEQRHQVHNNLTNRFINVSESGDRAFTSIGKANIRSDNAGPANAHDR
jgi:hypothetical protein